MRRPTNRDTLWRAVAEMTLGVTVQHAYAWSMMWSRLPNKAQTAMYRGDQVLKQLRSDLEAEMFQRGGPQDITVFYPRNREPGRRYPQPIHIGGRYPALPEQEWREIAEEVDKCTASMDVLIKFLSGHVGAKILDRAIKYQDIILREKMALEPYARKHIGFWSVLYPRGGVP